MITGVEGNGTLGFKGGNMKFQLGNKGKIFRGSDHASGLLRIKGRIPTTGGVKDCTTFRQLWSAKHVR